MLLWSTRASLAKNKRTENHDVIIAERERGENERMCVLKETERERGSV